MNEEHREVAARYKAHRKFVREVLEEQLLSEYRFRIDVGTIGDDVLRKARRDWYGHEKRRVNWDWENEILVKHYRRGPRGIEFSLSVEGQLCGLAVARVSRHKHWLSVTHLEGAPGTHRLKGKVLPIMVQGFQMYSAQISRDDEEQPGLRLLNPTDDAMVRYRQAGYNASALTKRLCAVVIQPRTGENHEHRNEKEPESEA
ncbi:hypothetical protein OU995_21350 [Roseateles sp. SL47]|uniref:hypothetical protein n=1 Tax=Roseateles sp. SL47 TaxID=2995138 RepID=UPI00226E63F0|nr:hypothetical protein [Roseateles sp. SL47]WAC72090.1 hypothetical protein OU995_21350 [Roseateles sp. SL47]